MKSRWERLGEDRHCFDKTHGYSLVGAFQHEAYLHGFHGGSGRGYEGGRNQGHYLANRHKRRKAYRHNIALDVLWDKEAQVAGLSSADESSV